MVGIDNDVAVPAPVNRVCRLKFRVFIEIFIIQIGVAQCGIFYAAEFAIGSPTQNNGIVPLCLRPIDIDINLFTVSHWHGDIVIDNHSCGPLRSRIQFRTVAFSRRHSISKNHFKLFIRHPPPSFIRAHAREYLPGNSGLSRPAFTPSAHRSIRIRQLWIVLKEVGAGWVIWPVYSGRPIRF